MIKVIIFICIFCFLKNGFNQSIVPIDEASTLSLEDFLLAPPILCTEYTGHGSEGDFSTNENEEKEKDNLYGDYWARTLRFSSVFRSNCSYNLGNYNQKDSLKMYKNEVGIQVLGKGSPFGLVYKRQIITFINRSSLKAGIFLPWFFLGRGIGLNADYCFPLVKKKWLSFSIEGGAQFNNYDFSMFKSIPDYAESETWPYNIYRGNMVYVSPEIALQLNRFYFGINTSFHKFFYRNYKKELKKFFGMNYLGLTICYKF